MKITSLLTFLLTLFLFSCNTDTNSSANQHAADSNTAGTTEEAAPQTPQGEKIYPSVPLDTLMMLFQQCDYVDYVFYYTNFSVSQNNQSDIQQSLRYISENAPFINEQCKPQGHIFFQVEGDNRLEGDLYFQQGCTYYVFYKDGKPAYANELMPAGIQFYNNIFQSVNQ